MKLRSAGPLAAIVSLALAAGAVVDLERVQLHTLTVYTTPALRDLLEKDVLPRYAARAAAADLRLEFVYATAGEEYNRLRMSGRQPEADVFLQASPLFIERAFDDGYFVPYNLTRDAEVGAAFKSQPFEDGRIWCAFAWSPLVEVYRPGRAAPDLANDTFDFGFPHPLLSSNGIYNVLFFESLDPRAGQRVLNLTVVQPVNARATITGVVDGSFEVTVGYEAVVLFFQKQGARVAFDLPLLGGARATTGVLFSAGLVNGTRQAPALDFIQFLFEEESQASLGRFDFRPVLGTGNETRDLPGNETGVRVLHFDWSQWARFNEVLPRYEVSRGAYA